MDIEENIKRVIHGFEYSERVTEIPFFFNNLHKPCKSLDVGCCENIVPFILNDMGFDSWCMDVRQYEKSYDKFFRADARQMPFENESFDFVFSISTIEHIGLVGTPYMTDVIYDSQGDIIAWGEILRVTKVGGVIILTVPYGLGNEGLFHWVRFYNKERIDKMLSDKRFKVTKLKYSVCKDNEWVEVDEKIAAETESEPNKVLANLCILGEKISK